MIIYRVVLPPVLILLIALGSSCGSRNQAQQTTEVADSKFSVTSDTLCYQQVIGRDSVRLQLFTKGTRVTGSLVLRPYEKDRAQGPVTGTRTGDEIIAEWQRSGEGITQVYAMNFVVTADTVRWRDGERVETGGKWLLKNPEEVFQYKLAKVDCK